MRIRTAERARKLLEQKEELARQPRALSKTISIINNEHGYFFNKKHIYRVEVLYEEMIQGDIDKINNKLKSL